MCSVSSVPYDFQAQSKGRRKVIPATGGAYVFAQKSESQFSYTFARTFPCRHSQIKMKMWNITFSWSAISIVKTMEFYIYFIIKIEGRVLVTIVTISHYCPMNCCNSLLNHSFPWREAVNSFYSDFFSITVFQGGRHALFIILSPMILGVPWHNVGT